MDECKYLGGPDFPDANLLSIHSEEEFNFVSGEIDFFFTVPTLTDIRNGKNKVIIYQHAGYLPYILIFSIGLENDDWAWSWIGANDIANKGIYVWSDGSPWDYVERVEVADGAASPDDNCGRIEFGWAFRMDVNCYDTYSGFCKATAKQQLIT